MRKVWLSRFVAIASSLFIIVLIGVAGPMPAAAIPYGFNSTCQFDCGNIGLSVGDSVSGEIDFFSASILPSAALTKADISSFSFDFGTVHIDDTTAVAFGFIGSLSADTSLLSVVAFSASEALDPTNSGSISGDTFILPIGNIFGNNLLYDWLATPSGSCDTATCTGVLSGSLAVGPKIVAGTTAKLTRVPEPATLALFAFGLVGLAGIRWRRKKLN